MKSVITPTLDTFGAAHLTASEGPNVGDVGQWLALLCEMNVIPTPKKRQGSWKFGKIMKDLKKNGGNPGSIIYINLWNPWVSLFLVEFWFYFSFARQVISGPDTWASHRWKRAVACDCLLGKIWLDITNIFVKYLPESTRFHLISTFRTYFIYF